MIKGLVTYADGFIGSRLTELLIERGYSVRALAKYNSFNNWGWYKVIQATPNEEIVVSDNREAHFCSEIQ